MANQEQLDILEHGPEVWNAWRKQAHDVIVDLSRADLGRADLRQAFLHSANLGGTFLVTANLGWADLREANLREANLTGASLVGANLSEANLSGADLRRANLSETNLRSANFGGANLGGAALYAANLSGADLSGADLREARLVAANLRVADVGGANFDGAYVGQTSFSNLDLGSCKNLGTVRHNSPSSVDIRTLQRSGPLPLSFLRGVGLPDALIEYLPSLFNRPFEFYSCFISYSHNDKSFARRLYDQLQERGIRCWLDEHQLLPGDDIYEGVDRGIRLWDKVLLCGSQSSLTSWWVDGEINRAFQKEAQLMKERGKKMLALVPLNLDGYLFKWESGKASEVLSRLAADFTGWDSSNTIFETQFERLVRALRADEGGREAPPPPRL